MQIQLRGGLPQGEANGLKQAGAEFADDDEPRLVLALVSTSKHITDVDTGETTAALKVRRVELIARGDDADALKRIMVRAHEERTGQATLPYDTEQAINDVFARYVSGELDGPGDMQPASRSDDVPGYSNGDQHEQQPPEVRDDDGPWPGDPDFSG